MKNRYINVYVVTREYGGPEEGGWWYNHYKPVTYVPIQPDWTEELTSKVREAVLLYYEQQLNEGNIYSMIGGQLVEVYCEPRKYQSETKGRPRYE